MNTTELEAVQDIQQDHIEELDDSIKEHEKRLDTLEDNFRVLFTQLSQINTAMTELGAHLYLHSQNIKQCTQRILQLEGNTPKQPSDHPTLKPSEPYSNA